MKGSAKTGIRFIIPYFLIFGVFQLFPILYSLFLSFHSFDGFKDPVFVGLGNYKRFFLDDLVGDSAQFLVAYFNTWKIWLPNICLTCDRRESS